jgi:hypothetical protein
MRGPSRGFGNLFGEFFEFGASVVLSSAIGTFRSYGGDADGSVIPPGRFGDVQATRKNIAETGDRLSRLLFEIGWEREARRRLFDTMRQAYV